jgi:DNA-binding transcriptional LysR family regulator
VTYTFAVATNDDMERGLHDLTLDFAVVTRAPLSRPLQVKQIESAKLNLFVPKRLHGARESAIKALKTKSVPLAIAAEGIDAEMERVLMELKPRLVCADFLAARAALEAEGMAAVLPEFLVRDKTAAHFWKIPIPGIDSAFVGFWLAWNPRLLRLNPYVVQMRDFLVQSLAAAMSK